MLTVRAQEHLHQKKGTLPKLQKTETMTDQIQEHDISTNVDIMTDDPQQSATDAGTAGTADVAAVPAKRVRVKRHTPAVPPQPKTPVPQDLIYIPKSIAKTEEDVTKLVLSLEAAGYIKDTTVLAVEMPSKCKELPHEISTTQSHFTLAHHFIGVRTGESGPLILTPEKPAPIPAPAPATATDPANAVDEVADAAPSSGIPSCSLTVATVTDANGVCEALNATQDSTEGAAPAKKASRSSASGSGGGHRSKIQKRQALSTPREFANANSSAHFVPNPPFGKIFGETIGLYLPVGLDPSKYVSLPNSTNILYFIKGVSSLYTSLEDIGQYWNSAVRLLVQVAGPHSLTKLPYLWDSVYYTVDNPDPVLALSDYGVQTNARIGSNGYHKMLAWLQRSTLKECREMKQVFATYASAANGINVLENETIQRFYENTPLLNANGWPRPGRDSYSRLDFAKIQQLLQRFSRSVLHDLMLHADKGRGRRKGKSAGSKKRSSGGGDDTDADGDAGGVSSALDSAGAGGEKRHRSHKRKFKAVHIALDNSIDGVTVPGGGGSGTDAEEAERNERKTKYLRKAVDVSDNIREFLKDSCHFDVPPEGVARPLFMHLMWEYIKQQKLQQGKFVRLDDELRKVIVIPESASSVEGGDGYNGLVGQFRMNKFIKGFNHQPKQIKPKKTRNAANATSDAVQDAAAVPVPATVPEPMDVDVHQN